jgi:O-antigen/teichoic acid export membrane protein
MTDVQTQPGERLGEQPAVAGRLVDGDRGTDLRRRVARGTLVNSGFQIGLTGLGTLQRLAVAAFLTREDYGLWGIMLTILIGLTLLKQIGVADKYIQQSEPDQEAAFQKAFTLELALSVLFVGVAVVALPLFALAYGRPQIVIPGIVLALAVPVSAFESPSWIPYRRMQYARQRFLSSVDPVVNFMVTIALVAAGLGYWGLIWGAIAGSVAGAIVCTLTCPYRLRLRFDRRTLRDYASFSGPLFGWGLSKVIVVQVTLLVANATLGLNGIAAIGIAITIAAFAEAVDSIVSQTIYPAVCAAADRTRVLAEAFVKSNRIALIWAMPFAVGLSLFAPDLVHFVLGSRWHDTVGLLVAFGLTCGLGQVAFNWGVFLRAVGNTRPIFIASVVELVVFIGVSVPGMYAFGLDGYAAGFAAATLVQVAIRGWYMRRLFHGFAVLRQLTRSIAPVIPPAAAVLLGRAVIPGDRTPSRALAELAVFALGTVVSTFLLERPLVVEALDYVRGRTRRSAARPVATQSPA